MNKALAWGLAAVAAAAAWLWLRVTFEYDGNVTGLYYSGGTAATPPQLAGEAIYQIAGDRGYDAQFYHYVAHDPLLSRGWPSMWTTPGSDGVESWCRGSRTHSRSAAMVPWMRCTWR
jgi:hypothetical protein